jgi:GNAT superfamily N-acetyltransferase
MGKNGQVSKLQRVTTELPAGFDALRAEARAEGYRFVERLATDWISFAARFDRDGEALLAARVNGGVLAGIGGLTIDPVVLDALRMRRFYVRLAYRRSGIGRKMATALLEPARSAGGLVTVNAAPASGAFWESLGFAADASDGHTHVYKLHKRFLPR